MWQLLWDIQFADPIPVIHNWKYEYPNGGLISMGSYRMGKHGQGSLHLHSEILSNYFEEAHRGKAGLVTHDIDRSEGVPNIDRSWGEILAGHEYGPISAD